MTDEKQESRIKVEALPPTERELTAEEQRQITGGQTASGTVHVFNVDVFDGDPDATQSTAPPPKK
ncbi:MAG: hypothetical protein DMF64_19965 [Acidobacteria bacterium]|nr:MAG: hypothetical protein DMF64_19965 [Acidobacteriota bacterium]